MTDAVARIVRKSSEKAFGEPLVLNAFRGHLVEAIVADALEPDWTWCAEDYKGYDFQCGDVRLEVKQSAVIQTWTRKDSLVVAKPSFAVGARQPWCDDTHRHLSEAVRAAHLYVFALHKVEVEPDHRDPVQWSFFVVPTSVLPTTTKTISLPVVRRLVSPCNHADLRRRANEVVAGLASTSSALADAEIVMTRAPDVNVPRAMVQDEAVHPM